MPADAFASENISGLINEISGRLSVSRLIVELLYTRGYRNIRDIEAFLNPRLSALPSPYLMKNMDTAVRRVRTALDSGERIGLFTDSDLDGLTSLASLMVFFERLGVEPYYRYYRDDESYGITPAIIDDFVNNDISLLITADSGIRDIEAVEYAVKKNIDVIVTDHHKQDTVLPSAVIVNPQQDDCPYPFSQLAGVGVVYKFIHAVLMSYHRNFNSGIIIISKEENSFGFAVLKNDVVIKRSVFESGADFINQISDLGEGGLIVADPLSAAKTGNPAGYQFIDYDRLLEIGASCGFNPLNREIYSDELEYSIDLYKEISFHSSRKIRSLLEEILPFTAIGTIADIMPLTDENRPLVSSGLKLLGQNGHPGLASLINGRPASSKIVSWEIAPLLNTPGRFGRTSLSVDFLLKKDADGIAAILTEIRAMNEERRGIINSLISGITDSLDSGNYSEYKNMVFIDSADIPDGVAGLIANRLVDYSGKPAVVLSAPDSDSHIKGSGRSYSGLDLFNYVQRLSDNFIRIGGHPQAFGFTIESGKVEETFTALDRILDGVETSAPSRKIDMTLSIGDLNSFSVDMIEMLEPFGNGNEHPVFYSPSVEIEEYSTLGADGRHGRFMIRGTGIRALGWNLAERMEQVYTESGRVSLTYTLEVNFFRNMKSVQMVILDMSAGDA